MTPEELAKHVVTSNKVGVWLWNCGLSSEPQDTARCLARTYLGMYEECGPELMMAADGLKSVWEVSGVVKKQLGKAYSNGGVCMLTGTPAMPAAQEISLLVDCENGHHEWHDDVAERSSGFFVVIDSVNSTGLKEIARWQAKDKWAINFRTTQDEIEEGLRCAAKNFLHASLVSCSDISLLEGPLP